MGKNNPVSVYFREGRYSRSIKLLDDLGKEPKRILDVGCGEGHFLKVLSKKFPSAELEGCEIDYAEGKRAESAVPGSKVSIGDFLKMEASPYDLIVALEVVEHSKHAGGFVGKLSSLL